MEEFQDINNFKMLSEEDPQATYFGYDRPDEQQFEEELNVDRRGVRQGNQGIRGDNISPQRNYEVRARGPEQRKPPYTMNDDQYHPTSNSYKGGGGYLNPVSAVEHEYVEQQFFPPGKLTLT